MDKGCDMMAGTANALFNNYGNRRCCICVERVVGSSFSKSGGENFLRKNLPIRLLMVKDDCQR
jgi:hypothetical protein